MNQYSPDQVSLPGETLEEWMQENSISVDQLSDRSGLSSKGIHSLINGGLSIDRKRAEALQNGTGVPGLLNSGLRSSFGAIKDWNVVVGQNLL